jgi:hypothetical protein
VDTACGLAPPADPANTVQVAVYYDADTRHGYTAYDTAGTLGHETAAMYGAMESFTFTPASGVNLVNRYSFVYSYNSSGDQYFGRTYATTAQAVEVLTNPPSAGHYQYMDMTYGFAAPANQVEVTAYRDVSAGYIYPAYSTTGLLSHEYAWFMGINSYPVHFGFDLVGE